MSATGLTPYVGYAAGGLTVLLLVPQAVRACRTREVRYRWRPARGAAWPTYDSVRRA